MSGFPVWVAGSGVVQGLTRGLAFEYLPTVLVLNAVASAETKTGNGWAAIRKAGHPGNGLPVRAVLPKALPVVNVFEESASWTATVLAGLPALAGPAMGGPEP